MAAPPAATAPCSRVIRITACRWQSCATPTTRTRVPWAIRSPTSSSKASSRTSPPAPSPAALAAEVVNARAGVYRHPRTMDVLKLEVVEGVLKVNGRNALLPVDDRVFLFEPFPAIRVEFEVDRTGRVTGMAAGWTRVGGRYEPCDAHAAGLGAPTADASERVTSPPEADAMITIVTDGEALVVRQGPTGRGRGCPSTRTSSPSLPRDVRLRPRARRQGGSPLLLGPPARPALQPARRDRR